MSGDATLANTGALTLNTVVVGKGGTGVTTQAPNGIIMSDGTGNTLASNFCSTGQALVATSASTWGCQSVTIAANTFVSGGNSFGAAATVGTNDNFALGLKTSGATRMTILSNGNVGIGTIAPSQALDVGTGALKTGNLIIAGNPMPFADPIVIGTDTPPAFMYLDSTYSVLRIGTQGASGYNFISFELPNGSQYQDAMALGATALAPSSGFDNTLNLGTPSARWRSITVGTGTSAFAGNVGIGTTAPSAKLDVVGTLKVSSLGTAASTDSAVRVDASGNFTKAPASYGSTFVDVSGGGGQYIGNGFSTVVMGTVVSDVSGNYNSSTGIYTVPSTGIYQITGTFRTVDGSPGGRGFGLGVHTSNGDGAWFLWHAVQSTDAYNRTTYPYIRVGRFTAGDQLRMFSYSDNGVTIGSAGMQIIKIAD